MLKLAVLMDPISTIKPYKDSSFAMLLEAQKRNWQLHYLEIGDLLWQQNQSYGKTRRLRVKDDNQDWFSLDEEFSLTPLAEMNVILMRVDPPFNMEYLYATHLLEQAQRTGTLVVNNPTALRDANEKLFTLWFPQCIPNTLVSSNAKQINHFIQEHQDIIIKPLDAMGGASIFRIRKGDPNTSVIIETITEYQTKHVMLQRFIPEVSQGDKRILLIDGEPIKYGLARIPAKGETRGNLAAGGTGKGVELTKRDFWICDQVSSTLKEKGLLFVGLDVIGDYLTEINVTSPTCIRELDSMYGLNIAGQLMDSIEMKLKTKT